jgi:1,4-dihydroxy-6-naphthoate synthase
MHLFHPEVDALEQVIFSEIMPRLRAGTADYGVCIHEGRFTWEACGLTLVEDLGERFERETASALPLGGLVARRALPEKVIHAVAQAIRESLEWGLAHREACLTSMRRYAQEERDEVLWGHVELYVNAWTRELGDEGRAAIDALGALARERGLLAYGEVLQVLES